MASVVNLAELIAYESLPFVFFSTKHLFFAALPSEVLKKIQKCLAFWGYMGVFGAKAVHRGSKSQVFSELLSLLKKRCISSTSCT